MREKIQFHHVSHVIVSFCIFVLTGKLADFLIGAFSSFANGLSELLVFLAAAACAVIAFHTFEKFVPSPEEGASAQSVMQGRFRERPFSMRRYVLETIPRTILTTALLIIAMYLVTIAFDPDGSLVNAELYAPRPIVVLSLLVIHPLAEEYIFRGLYYGKLRSMSPIFACLMQAVMFAISHNGVGGMMYALIAGIIMGTAAERSNGIAVPIAAHIIINLRTFLCSGILAEGLRLPIDLSVIGAGVVSVGILLLAARHLPSCGKHEKTAAEREEVQFDD